ncbi:SusC/RagA family TonB-linked outer membrane protein [Aureibacter tunicatorum]|uniref:TonB-linked SusC/RagA family outer membrane protein n=1 Tax=Aureibacter tunicatorum TaxID=866807 RepID=A0AAE3XKH9_9BACT|nr:SusC/RagA family TonB-linked outer membrane protein [Aureibacter tunicatorum]MDR6238190.1 TonB-linked SusC/RagA family outer membrane protein [Aureibacter tunicatorum]BDD03223.1 SusC/RagA family TonB-linked outer membrane protein [Aureibacter tunicatorum]
MRFYVILLAIFFCFLASPIVYGQSSKIEGTVTDYLTKETLPGVSISLKGTTNGTITNLDGYYSLDVESFPVTLQFQFIGYKTVEIEFSSAENSADVMLKEDVQQLNEVVVTAQQIEREKRTLGYAVTTLDKDEINKTGETNFVNSLSGKVAGVQVSSSGGGLGSSSRIVIRGTSSLSGNNQPLFVVDGVPIGNSNISSGDGISGAFDAGNGAGEINPADIESVTVLKGASAAALYGSRAANGAIIITTKRGKVGSKLSINYSTTFRTEEPLIMPDFQNDYSQGLNGKYDNRFLNGWGAFIEGQEVEDFNGNIEKLTAYPSNIDDFYQRGNLFINSIDLSSASETADLRLGITTHNQTGITPESKLGRYTISFNAGQKISKLVSARFSVNYVNSKNDGIVTQGGNSPNVLTSLLYGIPRNISHEKMKLNEDGSQNPLNKFTNSPYWIIEKNKNNTKVDRYFGFVQMDLKPNEWLGFTGRLGLDHRNEKRFRNSSKGTIGINEGSFEDDRIDQKELTASIMANVNRKLNEDLVFTAILGTEYNSRVFERILNTSEELSIDGIYAPDNALSNTPNKSYSERVTMGAYGDLSLTYRNYLTLNLTGRNDWSSTLPVDNRSYFYPSANMSFIFTDAFSWSNAYLSYGKVRVGAAKVGNDTAPYQLDFRFFPVTEIYGQYGLDNTYPWNGQSGYRASNTIPPQTLKPESQITYEIGTELQFFDGRFGLDLTYYHIRTKDQILSLTAPPETGYSRIMKNVGETENKGVELMLNTAPLVTSSFSWNVLLNFSKNNFKVVELAEGVDKLTIASGFGGLTVEATPGESLGIFGGTFKRDPDTGRPLVDENGIRLEGENERLGSINPDFTFGMTNSFQWKGINLSFLIDWAQGGLMYSSTVSDLRTSGLAYETGVDRDMLIIDSEALVDLGDGNTRENDIAISPEDFWTNYSKSTITEASLFDKTFVKLREIKISYSLPEKLLQRMPIRMLTVGLEARNLAILYKAIPHIDPETSLFQSSSDASGAIEMGGLPSTRSYGFNLKVGF